MIARCFEGSSQLEGRTLRTWWVLPGSLVALLLISGLIAAAGASPASAAVMTVTIDGSAAATGRVVSDPPGIDCSNAPASPHTACSFNFPLGATPELTATYDEQTVFTGWAGNAGGTCGVGAANPCVTGFVLFTPLTVTASFKPKPEPPVVAVGAATNIAFPAATLTGTVNPNSDHFPAECSFEYGATTGYGHTLPCDPRPVGPDTNAIAVTARTGLLDPGTVYHYRLLASNPGGTTEGADRVFTSATAPPDSCSNAAIRAQQGVEALALPACMAFEMVTPPDKGNQAATLTAGRVSNLPTMGADGRRIQFFSRAELGQTPGLVNAFGDTYVASRGAAGWTTSATVSLATLRNASGTTRIFTPDLGRWLKFVGTELEIASGQMRAYEGNVRGDHFARSPLLTPLDGHHGNGNIQQQVQGVSTDLSHALFQAGDLSTAYLPGDPSPAGDDAQGNTYVVSQGAGGQPLLALMARDADGKVWGGRCGAWVGGGELNVGRAGGRNQGAVSGDGVRVLFTTRPGQPEGIPCAPSLHQRRILQRLETDAGPRITQLTPEVPATGNDYFQGASADGSKVYFLTTRALAATDTDSGSQDCSTTGAVLGCDLYLYDSNLPAGQRFIQVSAGGTGAPTPGAGARVYRGVTAISGDGSHVYFVAQSVLTTTPNPAGATAVAGQPNLYLYKRDADASSGHTAFVGTLSPSGLDARTLFGSDTSFNNNAEAVPLLGQDSLGHQVGGEGNILVFLSTAALTPDDHDGGEVDIYRYDAAQERLNRVSRAAAGGSDNGPISVEDMSAAQRVPPSQFAEEGRWVSEDGRTIVFTSRESLTPGGDGLRSPYLWRAGADGAQLFRLPGELRDGAQSGRTVPTVSHDGRQVAFDSRRRLLPRDGDYAADVYVARTDGGFPMPAVDSPECSGDECQATGSTAPVPAPIGSLSFVGDGNIISVSPDRVRASLRVARLRAVRGSVARLRIRVPGAGRIRVTGPSVRRVRKSVSRPGTYAVRISLRPRVRKRLRTGRKPRLRTKARISYRARGGRSVSKSVKITFKQPKPRRARVTRGGR